MRPASLNSRRTSALPTSRNESVLSSHMSVSWLNERNAHQETACYRAQREALSSKHAGRSTKGKNAFPEIGTDSEVAPGN